MRRVTAFPLAICSIAVCAVLLSAWFGLPVHAEAADHRLNIVFIMADDMS